MTTAAWSASTHYHAGDQVTVDGKTYRAEHANLNDVPPGRSWEEVAGSGGAPGVAIVRAFPFAFNTPGIRTGHAVYTPTIGDLLLDAWVEIDTPWDGTTPLFDFGTFLDISGGAGFGYLGWAGAGPIAVSNGDAVIATGLLVAGGAGGGPGDMWTNFNANGGAVSGRRRIPAKFTTADPIKVVVSQNGQDNGADPGSTQGAAVLYLVTATPA